MRAIVRIALAIALLCSTSCTFIRDLFRDPVAKYINENWKPVDITEQRTRAIETAIETLADIPAADLAFGAPLPALERIVSAATLETSGITSVRMQGDEQLLRIDTAFDHQFVGPKTPQTAEERLLAALRPRVKGRLRFHAGITSATTQPDDTAFIRLTILPVFSGLTIDKVTVAGNHDVTGLGKAIASALNDYAKNITGELTRSPLMQLSIPTTLDDAKKAITFPGGSGDITIGVQPIHTPVRLHGVAWLITPNAITGIAQTVPVERVATLQKASVGRFEELQRKFLDLLNRRFDPPRAPAGPWTAIRKDLLAYITNSVVQQAAVCISSNADLPAQTLKEEVRFPDESTVDCTPTRDCSPTRACDFPPQRDTRDCSTCLLYRPGWPLGDGGCAQRGNDPFCELAKAAQNKIYEAEAAAKKLDCERLKAQEKLICEAEKAGEKALCETKKEFLKRLARTGKFANIEASVRGRTDDLRVCLERFRLSEDLRNLDINLKVTGAASADVDLKFIPLDIIGHLTCQVPWTESRSFRATLRESNISLSPRLQLITADQGARVRVTLPEGKVPLRLQPGPTEFLLTSPNLTLACRGLDLIRPLLIVATPFIPQLRGDIDYEYKEREMVIDLPMPRQMIGDAVIAGRLAQSPKALFLTSEVTGGN